MKKLNTRKRVQLICEDDSRTKQSFRDECDINNVVKKFTQTGQIPNLNNLEAQYGNAPDITLKESLDLVKNLHREFYELSHTEQSRFGGDPGNYAQFLDDYEKDPSAFYIEPKTESDTTVSQSVNNDEKVALPNPDEVKG